jgi:cephalosporin-C deacetylase-like acetyl esterase
LDGDAAFQYIHSQKQVPQEKILLHGHSIGGGIASEVAAMHPQVNYCNDRSFSSLSKQVRVMVFRYSSQLLYN